MAAARVKIAPEAVAEVMTIAAWWDRHRPAAPSLFVLELGKALSLLGTHPEVGARVRSRKTPELRVVVLRRSGYHVFYEHVPGTAQLTVVRVRHARRKPLRRRRR